jgi:four helix bundle suffix protein
VAAWSLGNPEKILKKLHSSGLPPGLQLLCLVDQASYLLKCQMERLESDFVAHGGFTERLYRVRTGRRGGRGQVRESSGRSDQSDPSVFRNPESEAG